MNGRVAVVLGASSGIGAAVARALSERGMKVALAARREDSLREVLASLSGRGHIVVPTDVTDRGQVGALISRAEAELGPVYTLVNCAGAMYYTLMRNLHEDEWERTIDVVCKGLVNGFAAALPGMLSREEGHLVTISSDAGRRVFPGLSVYSGAKSFVEVVSQGLRLETAGTGLRVTNIQPGNVDTDLANLSTDPEAVRLYGEPTGAKVLTPEDVAASVLYALEQPAHVAVNEILVQPTDEPC